MTPSYGQQYPPRIAYGPPATSWQSGQYPQPAESWPQYTPVQGTDQQPGAQQQPPQPVGQQLPEHPPVQQLPPAQQPPIAQQPPQPMLKQQPAVHQEPGQSVPQQFVQPQGQQTQFQPPLAGFEQPFAQPMAQRSPAQLPAQPVPAQSAPAQQAQSGQILELPAAQQLDLGHEAAHRQLAPDQPEPATSPFVDLSDSPDEITVFADLPGCRKDDISIRTSNSTLFITAERPSAVEGEARPLTHERSRRIERSIQLPSLVDAENAEATCEDGVCKVTLPKAEDARQTPIGVQ